MHHYANDQTNYAVYNKNALLLRTLTSKYTEQFKNDKKKKTIIHMKLY